MALSCQSFSQKSSIHKCLAWPYNTPPHDLKMFTLAHSSPVFTEQNKWLVSTQNAAQAWNGLGGISCSLKNMKRTPCYLQTFLSRKRFLMHKLAKNSFSGFQYSHCEVSYKDIKKMTIVLQNWLISFLSR